MMAIVPCVCALFVFTAATQPHHLSMAVFVVVVVVVHFHKVKIHSYRRKISSNCFKMTETTTLIDTNRKRRKKIITRLVETKKTQTHFHRFAAIWLASYGMFRCNCSNRIGLLVRVATVLQQKKYIRLLFCQWSLVETANACAHANNVWFFCHVHQRWLLALHAAFYISVTESLFAFSSIECISLCVCVCVNKFSRSYTHDPLHK